MSKNEVIYEIRRRVPTVRRTFLQFFSLVELESYLEQLESDAVKTLRNGGSMPQLAAAIGHLMAQSMSNPATTLDLIEALRHKGFVAEQGALALYRRLGMQVPKDRSRIEMRPAIWRRRVRAWLHTIDAFIEARLSATASAKR